MLRAAGLDKARLIAVCVDDQEAVNHIVDLVQIGISRHEDLRALVRPRPYAATAGEGRRLRAARDVRVRLQFGRKTLEAIGIDADRAAIVEDFIRTRDHDRIAIQQAEGIYAGIDLLRKRPKMAPFSEPPREAKPLNEEAEVIIKEEKVEG